MFLPGISLKQTRMTAIKKYRPHGKSGMILVAQSVFVVDYDGHGAAALLNTIKFN
jgi:hypothetical protein